ncbi:MAG: hypothetical protein WC872_01335 [Candidatus Absconditabacterales bacterium]
MTDSSKTVASQANQKQIQEDEEINSQLFGGSEDIFENSNIFQIDNQKSEKLTEESEKWPEKSDEFDSENIQSQKVEHSEIPQSGTEFSADEFNSENEFIPEDNVNIEEDDNQKSEKLTEKSDELDTKKHEHQKEINTNEFVKQEDEFKFDEDDEEDEETKDEGRGEIKDESRGEIKNDQDDIEIQKDSDSDSILKEKFYELYNFVSDIYEFSDLGEEEGFQLIGADNDKLNIIYKIFLDKNENSILISKIQTDKETDYQDQNDLNFIFNEDSQTLSVILNDVLLFDEADEEDSKKQMQIVDKINKFTFLVGEYHKKLEEEINDKKAEEEERRKLHDIFRNF